MSVEEETGEASRPKTTVLILTPFGFQGMGGIDRLMDEIRKRGDRLPDIELQFLTTRGPGSLKWAPLCFAAAACRMILFRVTRGRCVCHVNLGSRGSTYRKLVLARLARLLGHTTVIHLHGARFHLWYAGVHPLLRTAIRDMLHHAAAMVVLGSFWRDFAVIEVGLDPARVLVLPNASAQRPPRPEEDRVFRILFLGRLGARKGVPVLIDALGILGRTALDWQAVIAGDGDAEPFVTQAKTLGIAERVSFPGWLDDAAVNDRLGHASVLALPSELEGLPMSVIEAYAWGVPVIATPVGSVPDILQDGAQGLIVEIGDAAGLAAALERLARDPTLRRTMGENALRCHRERLEFDAYLTRLADCWRAAAALRS